MSKDGVPDPEHLEGLEASTLGGWRGSHERELIRLAEAVEKEPTALLDRLDAGADRGATIGADVAYQVAVQCLAAKTPEFLRKPAHRPKGVKMAKGVGTKRTDERREAEARKEEEDQRAFGQLLIERIEEIVRRSGSDRKP